MKLIRFGLGNLNCCEKKSPRTREEHIDLKKEVKNCTKRSITSEFRYSKRATNTSRAVSYLTIRPYFPFHFNFGNRKKVNVGKKR